MPIAFRVVLVLTMSASCLGSSALEGEPLSAPPPTDYPAQSLDLPAPRRADDDLPDGISSRAQCEAMVADAVAWAGMNALLVHAPSAVIIPTEDGDGASAAPAPTTGPLLAHAPFSLLPAEFPADQLEHARRLAPLFGSLVERVGCDVPWLSRTLRGAADGDDFTRRLLDLCARVQREGATQPARLALLRSDYMLHEPDGASGPSRLLQVELNTIASSFGALGSKACELHASMAQRWEAYRQHVWLACGKPSRLNLGDALPPSEAVPQLAAALARAHAEYGNADASVLFVVQPDERNAIDQQLISEQLWTAHSVRVVRRTLTQLAHEAKLVGKERRLQLAGGAEVSVVYFRAGYTPADYPSNRQWDARATLERSHAIKCPCIEHQLVGCKKVQQQLAVAGELERFVSAEDAALMRTVFAGLWSLSGADEPDDSADADEHAAAQHMRLALERPSEYVMKPQREGGGHNFFGSELTDALRTLSREQRSAYILMQRIVPRVRPAVLVRGGAPMVGMAESELGIYSSLLTLGAGRVLLNDVAGHLVRTKMSGVNEGGVAAGFAVISSPMATKAQKRGGGWIPS